MFGASDGYEDESVIDYSKISNAKLRQLCIERGIKIVEPEKPIVFVYESIGFQLSSFTVSGFCAYADLRIPVQVLSDQKIDAQKIVGKKFKATFEQVIE